MPGFDGTGPNGQGPMTGGGRGYCALPTQSGAPNQQGALGFWSRLRGFWPGAGIGVRPFGGRGGGRGMGRGMGRGRGRW